MARLDDIDRQLLMLLQEDDRQPLAALSEKTGVAVSTITTASNVWFDPA